MRALIATVVVAAFIALATLLPRPSLLPGSGFHPRFSVTLAFSL